MMYSGAFKQKLNAVNIQYAYFDSRAVNSDKMLSSAGKRIECVIFRLTRQHLSHIMLTPVKVKKNNKKIHKSLALESYISFLAFRILLLLNTWHKTSGKTWDQKPSSSSHTSQLSLRWAFLVFALFKIIFQQLQINMGLLCLDMHLVFMCQSCAALWRLVMCESCHKGNKGN